MTNDRLIDGVEVMLSCSECGEKLMLLLPMFNCKATIPSHIWKTIIANGWIAVGDEDTLFCCSCRNE